MPGGGPPEKRGKKVIMGMMTNREQRDLKSGREALPVQKHYYRLDEVAVYFSISRRTLYRLLDEGHLQPIRIRGCLRVSAEQIRRFAALLEKEAEL